jgi:cholesterol transport system auxiliary component
MGVCSALRVGLVCICLGGCAMAGITTDSTPTTYQINPPDTRDLRLAHWPVNLTVQMPTASRAVDSNRIVVARAGRISYFAGAAWTDRLPRLLQASMAAALQDSGAFRAVLSTQDRVDSDYALTVEVRNFQIEVSDGNAASAVITLIVRMASEKSGKIVATKEFSARVPSNADDLDTSVAALQKAFGQLAVEMVRWTSSQRGRSVASN